MSLYQLQKLMYDVNRDAERKEEYRKDPCTFVSRYDLTSEEREAILSLDIRTLYTMGVHPLLLRPFTLLHCISAGDYAKSLAGLE